ncbi:MAG: aminotransferase class I/II-fold pyridoxal phosphate-dependent enzyme [Clostridia bacterium]|nr:aminotransferase class I/II-fold pyridoxal phosphate-dependent enzyme [Clostridia bacterium]
MEILQSLIKHQKKEKASFHMPGHKGRGAAFCAPFESEILSFDTTELSGTDCLCHPSDAILRSQKWAATLYGAKEAFYLVNGSTSGILSMFDAFFSEGDAVLVDRACHRSVVNALSLCGLVPIYIASPTDRKKGVPKGFDKEKIAEALKAYPEVRGVFLTSPNYYGMVSKLKEIAELVHASGKVLLVDEAHGAHFPFSKHFPTGAIRAGADASVVSLHKSLPSPNQTALLLLREEDSGGQVRRAVNTFQTSSPSYVLLSCMEQALSYAETHGEEATERFLSMSEKCSKYRTEDPFKLLLKFDGEGYRAEEILRERYGIYAELCDRNHILLMCSWQNSEADFALLGEALSELAPLLKETLAESDVNQFCEGKAELNPREVRKKESEWVLLSDCAGRISAQTVTAFPPCIPILMPGENITKEQIDEIAKRTEYQALDGVKEGKLLVIK